MRIRRNRNRFFYSYFIALFLFSVLLWSYHLFHSLFLSSNVLSSTVITLLAPPSLLPTVSMTLPPTTAPTYPTSSKSHPSTKPTIALAVPKFSVNNSHRAFPRTIPKSIQYSASHQVKEFPNFTPRKKRAKVIDVVLFNTELDILELRLITLFSVVDWFIIAESNQTFQGGSKPLHFQENFIERFQPFREKLIYVLINDYLEYHGGFSIETKHRNLAGQLGIKKVPRKLKNNDLIFSFDVDEILRPDVINWLAWYEGYSQEVHFYLHWNIYGFMWSNPNSWYVSGLGLVNHVKNVCLDDEMQGFAVNSLRSAKFCGKNEEKNEQQPLTRKNIFKIGNPYNNMPPQAGWHCSWCFPLSKFANKLESFAHNEMNEAKYKQYEVFIQAKRNGYWFAQPVGVENPISFADSQNKENFAPPGFDHNLWGKGEKWRYLIDANITGDELNEKLRP